MILTAFHCVENYHIIWTKPGLIARRTVLWNASRRAIHTRTAACLFAWTAHSAWWTTLTLRVQMRKRLRVVKARRGVCILPKIFFNLGPNPALLLKSFRNDSKMKIDLWVKISHKWWFFFFLMSKPMKLLSWYLSSDSNKNRNQRAIWNCFWTIFSTSRTKDTSLCQTSFGVKDPVRFFLTNLLAHTYSFIFYIFKRK